MKNVIKSIIVIFIGSIISVSCGSDEGGSMSNELPENDQNQITEFTINDIGVATINEETRTITINILSTIDITALMASVEISEDATISPDPGEIRDYSTPVIYTVTAEDSSVKEYTVGVYVIDSNDFDALNALYKANPEATLGWDTSDINIGTWEGVSIEEGKVVALNLSGKGITELPSTLELLTNLRTLDVSENSITQIPTELGNLANLISLNISDNPLTELPEEVCKLEEGNIAIIKDEEVHCGAAPCQVKTVYQDEALFSEYTYTDGKVTKITFYDTLGNEWYSYNFTYTGDTKIVMSRTGDGVNDGYTYLLEDGVLKSIRREYFTHRPEVTIYQYSYTTDGFIKDIDIRQWSGFDQEPNLSQNRILKYTYARNSIQVQQMSFQTSLNDYALARTTTIGYTDIESEIPFEGSFLIRSGHPLNGVLGNYVNTGKKLNLLIASIKSEIGSGIYDRVDYEYTMNEDNTVSEVAIIHSNSSNDNTTDITRTYSYDCN